MIGISETNVKWVLPNESNNKGQVESKILTFVCVFEVKGVESIESIIRKTRIKFIMKEFLCPGEISQGMKMR